MKEEKFMVPTASMNEHTDLYELTFELPGVSKSDIELHVENRSLGLKTKGNFQSPAGFKPVSVEFERVNYATSVDLPEKADPSTVSAKLENGILRVTVQKRPETQARTIAIA